MYSPETLLQIHHLRHDELVAAAQRTRAVHAEPRPRAVPTAGVAVGRALEDAVAGTRRAVADLRAQVASLAGAGTAGQRARGGDPLCCPA